MSVYEGVYEVIVGNIGYVYTGSSKLASQEIFDLYVAQSKANVGRASGEHVILFLEGVPVREYIPLNSGQ